MALMKCPECGRENVSDSAEMCPDCGYSIKKYVEKLREDEEKEKRRIERENESRLLAEKENAEYEKLKPELERKLKAIDNMPAPEKPKFLNMCFTGDGSGLTWLCVIAFIILILLIICAPAGSIFWVLLLIADIIFGIFWAALGYSDYQSFLNLCEQKTKPQYKEEQKEKLRKEYREIAYNLAVYGTRTPPPVKISTPRTYNYTNSHNVLKCPVCGSSNVKRLSNLNRSVSVAAWGAASSKIGKQYECNKCKHKW